MIDTERADLAPAWSTPAATKAPAAPVSTITKTPAVAWAVAAVSTTVAEARSLAGTAIAKSWPLGPALTKSWSLRRALWPCTLAAWRVAWPTRRTLRTRLVGAWGHILLSFHTTPRLCGNRRLSSGDDVCRHVSYPRRPPQNASRLQQAFARRECHDSRALTSHLPIFNDWRGQKEHQPPDNGRLTARRESRRASRHRGRQSRRPDPRPLGRASPSRSR